MFSRLFNSMGGQTQDNRQAGRELFEAGMRAAKNYKTRDAIDLYTRSFAASPNPAPLINRSKLYMWQIRYDKAIEDLEQAATLDTAQGDEFGVTIATELKKYRVIAAGRFNGIREKMIADLRRRGEFAHDEVAERLIDVIFKGSMPLKMFHVLNEIDSVRKFETLEDFPEIEMIAPMIPAEKVEAAVNDRQAVGGFEATDNLFRSMLCVYDHEDMTKLRCRIVYNICCEQPADAATPSMRPIG